MKLLSLKKSFLIGSLLIASLFGTSAYAYPVYVGVHVGGWGYPHVYVANYYPHYYGYGFHPYYAYYHPGYYGNYHYHYVYNYNINGQHYHYVYNYNYHHY